MHRDQDSEIQALITSFQARVSDFVQQGRTVIASSSFQTHSIPMLHIISQMQEDIPIYFLQTGFHFPETIQYKQLIASRLGLRVIDLQSSIPKSMQRDEQGRFYFISNPSYCCYINKVKPMEDLLDADTIWITGVRQDQNENRSGFAEIMPGPKGSLRYHPMLAWDKKRIWRYIYAHNLPHHPLDAKGYVSVGCEPCTAPSFDMSGERQGRWAGLKKTECGLHTDLAHR